MPLNILVEETSVSKKDKKDSLISPQTQVRMGSHNLGDTRLRTRLLGSSLASATTVWLAQSKFPSRRRLSLPAERDRTVHT